MWRRRWPYFVAIVLGVAYALSFMVLHPWSSGMSTEDIWEMQGGILQDSPARGLHILDLLAIREGFFYYWPDPCRFIAADLLQQVVGSIAHLCGLQADRYSAFHYIVDVLGPTASLALWLTTSALVGAGMGVTALALGRLLFRLARKAAEIPEEK